MYAVFGYVYMPCGCFPAVQWVILQSALVTPSGRDGKASLCCVSGGWGRGGEGECPRSLAGQDVDTTGLHQSADRWPPQRAPLAPLDKAGVRLVSAGQTAESWAGGAVEDQLLREFN